MTAKLNQKVNYTQSNHQDAFWATGHFQSWTILTVCTHSTPRSFLPSEEVEHEKNFEDSHHTRWTIRKTERIKIQYSKICKQGADTGSIFVNHSK